MDSHVHLDYFEAQKRTQIIDRARAVGVETLISVCVHVDRWQSLRQAISAEQRGIFFTAGTHPTEIREEAAVSLGGKLERILGESTVRPVAVGEIGLDYAALSSSSKAERQRQALRGQLEVARDAGLPAVIHCRDAAGGRTAFDDLCVLLKKTKFPRERALLHCYSYGPEELWFWQGGGGFISFSGILTYGSAAPVQEALRGAELDRVLFETDCPFLLPEPLRRKRQMDKNEPANVKIITAFAAKLLGLDAAAVDKKALENGKRFFGLGDR